MMTAVIGVYLEKMHVNENTVSERTFLRKECLLRVLKVDVIKVKGSCRTQYWRVNQQQISPTLHASLKV